jgi:hypothetical protein
MQELQDSKFELYKNSAVPGNGVVRVGDLELDGHLDLAITLRNGSEPRTFFFKNLDCSNALADGKINPGSSGKPDPLKCRYFQKNNMTKLISYEKSTLLTSFFDFGEIGYINLTKHLQFPDDRDRHHIREAAS